MYHNTGGGVHLPDATAVYRKRVTLVSLSCTIPLTLLSFCNSFCTPQGGTGSVSCYSAFVLHSCRFLNQEELMEREAMVQNSSSHCRDLPCRKMHPHKIMHDPVDIQSFLEASCIFGIHIGLPPIGRTPASQRSMEGFQMIGMNLCVG